MTLVDTTTGEIVEPMSAAEAEVVTDAITWRLDALATTHEEVMPMIREALTRRAWEALGYRSPGEYAADRFGGALTRLSIPVRQAVVQELTEVGMSTRAIAPVVGVSVGTIHADRQVFSAEHLTQPPDPATGGEAVMGSGQTPNVVGIDGKTYSRPTPIDDPARAAAAAAEFPDLAYYAALGEHRDVINMAADLRTFRDRGELETRLDILRRSIAVDRAKRDGTYRPGTTAVMGDDGEYRMALLPATPITTRTCPTCSGRGVIEE